MLHVFLKACVAPTRRAARGAPTLTLDVGAYAVMVLAGTADSPPITNASVRLHVTRISGDACSRLPSHACSFLRLASCSDGGANSGPCPSCPAAPTPTRAVHSPSAGHVEPARRCRADLSIARPSSGSIARSDAPLPTGVAAAPGAALGALACTRPAAVLEVRPPARKACKDLVLGRGCVGGRGRA